MEAHIAARPTTPREGFVVRIRSAVEEPVGVGVVVGERHILTCAHVVNVALGRSKIEREPPAAQVRVQVEFPLLGDAEGAPIRSCKVAAWAPPPAAGAPGRDVAGLEIVGGEPLPAGAGPARLVDLGALRGTEVSVFGYPGNPPRKAGGGWSLCRLRGTVGGGLVQIDVDGGAALRAQPGYSGSPVIVEDERGDVVVGMLTLASADGSAGDAYAVPLSQLIEAWPHVLADNALPTCPYRGLQAFTEADAAAGVFVGREAEVDRLRRMVHDEPAVLVAGPSGVGKTSLVTAGLIPALRQDGWLVAAFRPGAEPFATLARAVLEIERPGDRPSLSDLERCAADVRERGLSQVGPLLAVLLERPVALVCDQLEEALTLGEFDEQTRRLFLDVLLPPPGPAGGTGRFRVVATVRSDFLPALLDLPGLGARLQDRQLYLSPLSIPALTRVVVEPAQLADVAFSAGLPEMIARDASRGRGGLPLLEFTLAELWPMQRRRRLSFDDYHAIGGVAGALNRHAERAFHQLRTVFAEDRIRRVLLRMVRTRGGAADAVRAAVGREQLSGDWEVAEALARPACRLVVLGREAPGAPAGTTEIAHEALIREWRRLAGWVDEDAKFQRWLAVMEERADEEDLLSDARIAEAQVWLAERREDIPDAVVRLVARSRSALQRRLDELAEARRASEEYFRAIVQHTRDPILIVNDDNRIQYASPAAASLFGSAPLVGMALPGLVLPADRRVAAQLLHLVRTGNATAAATTVDWRLPDSRGVVRVVEVACADLRQEPAVRGIMVTLRDSTELWRRQAELTAQAATDPLTGLGNRAALEEWIRLATARGSRPGQVAGLVLLDLDDFKVVNDTLGHTTGDRVLVELGRRLAGLCPQGLARLGGDEFAAMVEVSGDTPGLEALVERLIAAVGEPIQVDQTVVQVSGSVGMVLAATAADAADLLPQADLALYAAKSAGRGQWRWYDPTTRDAAVERAGLFAQLPEALADGQFRLQYQPIVDLTTGLVAGFEALVRWQHPERGVLHPALFIPGAEESGQIVPLGAWVLRTAIATAADWHRRRRRGGSGAPYVSVNVSTRQFRAGNLVDVVHSALDATGLPAQQLVLEITESMLLHSDDWQAMKDLTATGVRLAVDDFGTGYSSLGYLQQISIQMLKIDRSFVDGASSSPQQKAIIESIVGLAKTLKLAVVAEGIESRAERDLLVGVGCQYGQGVLFSPPLPPDEAYALIAGQ